MHVASCLDQFDKVHISAYEACVSTPATDRAPGEQPPLDPHTMVSSCRALWARDVLRSLPCTAREFTKSPRADTPYEKFISQYETDLPAADGPITTSHPLLSNMTLRASVKEKEIAVMVYNLVAAKQVWAGDREGKSAAMVLQRDDLHDRVAESQALGTDGLAEFLRL